MSILMYQNTILLDSRGDLMKKGQAAMEFLMTYGWAILVVLAAIAALAFFGVLDLGRILPETCNSSGGVTCVDKPVIYQDNDIIQLAIRNNIGRSAAIIGATTQAGDDCTVSDYNVYLSGVAQGDDVPTMVDNGELALLNITCANINDNSRIKSDITVTYRDNETTQTHPIVFNVRGRSTVSS